MGLRPTNTNEDAAGGSCEVNGLERVFNRAVFLRYFITFACYGARLHGDESGSVDRHHNVPGNRLLDSDPLRVTSERRSMTQPPYWLDRDSRAVVLAALRGHCAQRGWSLLAAHVRTNHVHAVVEADVRPEKLMNEFKSYASRELNRLGRDGPGRRRWARHGSTRWLWEDGDVHKALRYFVEEQGEPMALFIAEKLKEA
jgi:REP element-mobilizing transposase RayT